MVNKIKVTVRQELLNLQPPATVVDAPAASDQPAKSFLANLLGQDQDDDSDAESTPGSPAQIVERELSDYISERGCRIDNCPYQWWKEREARFPCMSQLAKRYLNVQVTSASSERLFSAFGLVYEHRRMSLLKETASATIFLHENGI